MDLEVVALSERPELAAPMWGMADDWPPFMQHDPLGDALFAQLADVFPEHQLVGLDGDGRVVAKVNAVPFAWAGRDDDLPGDGWDGVLVRGFRDRRRGTAPTAVSLLEARVDPALRGRGHSRTLLTAARERTRALGLLDLVGPVRPAGKGEDPRATMADFAARTRPDGLPADPWLRTHVRLGARVVGVCPTSMVVSGTLDRWRTWTGLPFDGGRDVEVPGALVPVLLQPEHGTAVYVEPNVWVHHDLR